MPLAATLATAGVFDAFGGAAKTDALLHGHSYSGHAIGLSAAAAALAIFDDPAANPALCAPSHLRTGGDAAPASQERVSRCVEAAAAVMGGRELDTAQGAGSPRAGSCVEEVAAVVGDREVDAAGGAGSAGAGDSGAAELSRALMDGPGSLGPSAGAAVGRTAAKAGRAPGTSVGSLVPSSEPAGSTSTVGGSTLVGGLGPSAQGCACEQPCGRLVELWDPAATATLSMRPDVARVVAVGARPVTV